MRVLPTAIVLLLLSGCDRPGANPADATAQRPEAPGSATPSSETPAPESTKTAEPTKTEVVDNAAGSADAEPEPPPAGTRPDDDGGEYVEATLAPGWYEKHCADLTWAPKDRRCWDHYLIGTFDFGDPLVFDKELTLELPDPGPMPKKRWRRVKAKINVRQIAKAMGVRGGFGLSPDRCEGPAGLIIFEDECPFYRPGFWWPTDDQVFLVIPHSVRISPVTARTITVARKEGETWKATTIETTLPGHAAGGSWILGSGPLLRGDGLEFWTWAEGWLDGTDEREETYICRIGWHGGALRQACAKDWTTQFTRFHQD